MRCLIVDDHPLTRDGTAMAVRAVRPSAEVLEAGSLKDGLERLETSHDVDLVLLDLDLTDSKGIDTLRSVKEGLERLALDARVVVLSGACDADLVQQVINHYATGFILKATSKAIFEQAIALTLAGGVYIPELVLRQMDSRAVATWQHGSERREPELSARESEVVALLVQGLTYKRIARELERMDGKPISEHTVRAHVGNVAWKLGVTENVKAGVMAEIAKRGLLFPLKR
jgi:DNA-binding NarL/FixJ family response regulator